MDNSGVAYGLESSNLGLSIIRVVVINCHTAIISLEAQIGGLRNKVETPILGLKEQTGSPIVGEILSIRARGAC